MSKNIWREVVHYEVRHNPGYHKHWAVGGSRRLHLSCGHSVAHKLSRQIPKRVRCYECESIRSGSKSTTYHNDGSTTTQVWDEEKQIPVFETRNSKGVVISILTGDDINKVYKI